MDQAESDELMSSIEKVIKSGNNRIILELSELKYMNSTGLNIMINVLTKTRDAGGKAILANISENVKQLFVVTKLDTIFSIAATKDEALKKLIG